MKIFLANGSSQNDHKDLAFFFRVERVVGGIDRALFITGYFFQSNNTTIIFNIVVIDQINNTMLIINIVEYRDGKI